MRLKIIDLSLKDVAISHPAPLQLIDLNTTRNKGMYVMFQNKIPQGNGAFCIGIIVMCTFVF